jgi:hypothetical protein
MANIRELDKAIAAHSMWKAYLRTAIDKGELHTSVEKIQDDHECAFGQWLFGSGLTAQDRETAHYKTVKELHAKFHEETADIADLALKGKKSEAEALMASNSAYSALSAKLTAAMMAWKKVSK